jgi:N-acetylmuramoyl-L-alanine amidase
MKPCPPAARFGLFLAWLAAALATGPESPRAQDRALGTVAAGPAIAGSISDVRLGVHPGRTRFVMEMSAPLEFELTHDENPDRILLDFPPMAWRAGEEVDAGVGLVAGHYHAGTGEDGTRVVLDLAAPVEVRDVFYLPAGPGTPYRFVLDLAPRGADDPAEDRGPPPPEVVVSPRPAITPASAGRSAAPSAPPPPTGDEEALPASIPVAPVPPIPPRDRPAALPVVAVDAGHGGFDPGATGIGGTFEKHITLSVARELAEELRDSGRYRVVLTRDSDVFLRLRERVRIAREERADIFLSLHADSNPDPLLHGVTVYTLSDQASDREAAMMAARENRVDALAGVEMDPEDDVMASILIDLAQRATRRESDALANFLVNHLGDVARLLNNTHRHAGFAVLTAPDVPSVLVELGHLSNAEDEQRLRSPEHRTRLAEALADAVDDYFAWAETAGG